MAGMKSDVELYNQGKDKLATARKMIADRKAKRMADAKASQNAVTQEVPSGKATKYNAGKTDAELYADSQKKTLDSQNSPNRDLSDLGKYYAPKAGTAAGTRDTRSDAEKAVDDLRKPKPKKPGLPTYY